MCVSWIWQFCIIMGNSAFQTFINYFQGFLATLSILRAHYLITLYGFVIPWMIYIINFNEAMSRQLRWPPYCQCTQWHNSNERCHQDHTHITCKTLESQPLKFKSRILHDFSGLFQIWYFANSTTHALLIRTLEHQILRMLMKIHQLLNDWHWYALCRHPCVTSICKSFLSIHIHKKSYWVSSVPHGPW